MSSSWSCIIKHPAISLVESCISLIQIKQIHTQVLAHGLLGDPFFLGRFVASVALSSLNLDNLYYAEQILNQCPSPTLFAMNSMIRAYSQSTKPLKSFDIYFKILHSGFSPDNYTINFLVRTCAQLRSHRVGSSVHSLVVRYGFESDAHIQSGLVHMYAELGHSDSSNQVYNQIQNPDLVIQTAMVGALASTGKLGFARKLFDKMPHKDPTSWNAMIAGYSQCGKSKEALDLFISMQIEGVRINEVTLVSVLSACAHLGALYQGRWIHAYIERNKLCMTVTLGTALVDTYSKCGNVARALDVFWKMREKNVYTWSSMMCGLSMNGESEKCLELFVHMKENGTWPNEIAFISVLHACSIAGKVEIGQKLFDSMANVYGLEYWPEHYGCMVDLYGRAGRLSDAINFINNMPIRPHVGAWASLLNACKIHKNVRLAEFAMNKILELDTRNDGAYVLLSNIYADSKNWEGVNKVRQLMKSNGVKKLPGCSVIEVDREVHEFFVGDKTHPEYAKIEIKIGEISKRLRLAGRVALIDQVLFDIDEEEKEYALDRHSEKVAIAFGLIKLPEYVPIRIVNNLRVCTDCHEVSKMISKVYRRELILRDRNRFHHIRAGQCSCKDYW